MNPEQYKKSIIQKFIKYYKNNCLCNNKTFRKILSFNFENYGISPTALADSEILISQIIHNHYESLGTDKTNNGAFKTIWKCTKCGALLTEIEEQFSISMYRSYIDFENKDKRPNIIAPYLIGFYGFSKEDFTHINDFIPAKDSNSFINSAIYGNIPLSL